MDRRPWASDWTCCDDGTMTDVSELEALSTRELHHRAIRTAERHLDIRFLWRLLEYIPLAEVAAEDEGEAEYDIQEFSGWMRDYAHRGGKLDDALRPVYIDYLRQHPGDGN
jgi:hypothetical protein